VKTYSCSECKIYDREPCVLKKDSGAPAPTLCVNKWKTAKWAIQVDTATHKHSNLWWVIRNIVHGILYKKISYPSYAGQS
jgi:hypothetical protein